MARGRKKAMTIQMKEVDPAMVVDRIDESNSIKLAIAKKAEDFTDEVQELAFTKLIHYNYLIHEFKEISPEPTDWVVSEYYPQAKNGAVYVDRPKNARQEILCEKKAEIMKKKKLRYIVYKPKMPFEELAAEFEASLA